MGLSQQVKADLTRLGERIQKTFLAIKAELPEKAKTIGGFARYLDYNRSNSQRFFTACKASDGLQVLVELPGVQALLLMQQKLTPLIPAPLLKQLKQVTDLFEQCLNQHASSHAQLKRMLSTAKQKTQNTMHGDDHKAQLYYAAKSLLRFSVEEVFCVYILKENKANPAFLQEVALISKSGIKREAGAVPFVQFYTHPNPDNFTQPLNISQQSRLETNLFTIGVSEEYSTSGFLNAFSTFSPSNSGLVFDPLPSDSCDATFVVNNPDEVVNPLNQSSPCSSTSLSIKNPTKAMTMLVLIEKQIDKCSTVNIGCYHNNQKVEDGKLKASDMWTERFPEFPELKISQTTDNLAHFQLQQDHKDKLRYLLDIARVDIEDYICYSTHVNFPIWSSTYRIYFEHQ